MGTVSSGFDVQKAVYDLLIADNTVKGLVGSRVYDAPPPNPVLPYVVIGDMVASPPETTSTSTIIRYSMDISAVIGPNPAADTFSRGFEVGHDIVGAAQEALHNIASLSLGNGLSVIRVKMGQLKTERVRGQLDNEPDYRLVTLPVEIWVWQSRVVVPD